MLNIRGAKSDLDLMVIGVGSPAFAAAIRAAELGANVVGVAEVGVIGPIRSFGQSRHRTPCHAANQERSWPYK